MNFLSFFQGAIVVLTATFTPAASIPVTPSSVPNAEIIHAQDSIEYMNQKTTYSIDFPKDGGKITGNMSGLCNGTIDGDFDGKMMKGTITGTCTVGFIPVSAAAKFTGELSPTNRINLTVDAEKPLQGRYYPSLKVQNAY